jgi:hypothetical protein
VREKVIIAAISRRSGIGGEVVNRAEHKRLYDAAYKRIYVDPILQITISRTGNTWGWQIVDINGSQNGRSWCLGLKDGYTDIRQAAEDAEIALIRVEKLCSNSPDEEIS